VVAIQGLFEISWLLGEGAQCKLQQAAWKRAYAAVSRVGEKGVEGKEGEKAPPAPPLVGAAGLPARYR
jgi:hypothetical protein